MPFHFMYYKIIPLRDHETTILHILGTEILGLFQIDLLSNFMLEMTTEHIPALLGSQFCGFLAFWKCLILKYRKFYGKEKFNFVNVIIGWLQSYFMWLITIYQVNFSWKDQVYLLLKNASFGGWVIFQAFSIYLGYQCQNLNFIANFKFLAQMMKNEGSNSLTDIKSTHLKIALLFLTSEIDIRPILVVLADFRTLKGILRFSAIVLHKGKLWSYQATQRPHIWPQVNFMKSLRGLRHYFDY